MSATFYGSSSPLVDVNDIQSLWNDVITNMWSPSPKSPDPVSMDQNMNASKTAPTEPDEDIAFT